MRETEVKILGIDRTETEAKLLELGAEYDFTKEIFAILFDTPEGRILQNGDLLRLRKKGETVLLTHKKKISSSVAKVMQETEVQVGDFEKMRDILRQMGMIESLSLRKTRTQYRLGEIKIVFDKYHEELEHIPEFMEIEAEDEVPIYEFVTRLGFRSEDCKPWGVKDLIEFYQI